MSAIIRHPGSAPLVAQAPVDAAEEQRQEAGGE